MDGSTQTCFSYWFTFAKCVARAYDTAVRIEDMWHKGKVACLLKQNRIKSQEDAKQTKQSQQTHSHGC